MSDDWEWSGPFLKVYWDEVDGKTPRQLAKWLRQRVDEERARRRWRRAYVPARVWRSILERHDYRCAYCGVRGRLQREHRMPIARGGPDVPSNIVPACEPCNRAKGTADPADWPVLFGPAQ